jgi:hypothetical protein
MFGSSASVAERGIYVLVQVLSGTIREAGMGTYRPGNLGRAGRRQRNHHQKASAVEGGARLSS